jgi:NADH-quinone oxidoreductase subunit E
VAVEAKHVRSLIEKYRGQKWALVQILLDIQDNLHWLPPEAMEAVAETLDIPLVHVFGVATCYKSVSPGPSSLHGVHGDGVPCPRRGHGPRAP